MRAPDAYGRPAVIDDDSAARFEVPTDGRPFDETSIGVRAYVTRIPPEKLAEYDNHNPNAYPEFDKLYAALKTKADMQQVREVLREELRRKVADNRGKAFVVDYELDTVLHQGILKACKAGGVDPKKIKEYKSLAVTKPTPKGPDMPQD